MKKTKVAKIFSLLAVSVFTLSSLSATIAFDDLDLSNEDNLIFSVENKNQNSSNYKSLFVTKLGAKKVENEPKLLTCYPEQMELLNNGKTLQIRNRYGKAFYDTKNHSLKWESYTSSIPVDYSKTPVISVNSNGTFYCYVKKIKNATGQLILVNVESGEEKIIAEDYNFNLKKVDVKWSPSGQTFIYQKNGKLYFETPAASFKNIQLPENYRVIGNGFINNVEWTQNNNLLYINTDIIYKISENELYTRGLYSNLVGNGVICGRLPFAFDSVYDNFSVDKEGNQIVLITSKNMAYHYTLGVNGYEYVNLKSVHSLTDIKGTILDYKVFWNAERKPLLWIDIMTYEKAKRVSKIYSVEKELVQLLEVQNCTKYSLSPDTRFLAFNSSNSLFVYDISTWKEISTFEGEKNSSFVWASNYSLYVGGEKTVKLWYLNVNNVGETQKLLFLSSCGNSFIEGGRIVTTFDNEKFFVYVPQNNVWQETKAVQVPEKNEKNGKYRVFLGNAVNSNFENNIYVRSLSGKVVTYTIFAEGLVQTPAKKKVSIVFEAMDSSEGLAYILDVLNEYNLKGTFFINGEFIRRYPMETKLIVNSGSTCGSSFYSTVDLMNGNFVADNEFVKRGLARNEDEFFAVTGGELALLWHAPNYSAGPAVKKAGEEAGYTYVDSYSKYNDRVTLESVAKNPKEVYLSANELLDVYVNSAYDGMVISVTVGRTNGRRNDYLWQQLDLLISSLLDNGIEIVCLE